MAAFDTHNTVDLKCVYAINVYDLTVLFNEQFLFEKSG
jgi:hypothetical protein